MSLYNEIIDLIWNIKIGLYDKTIRMINKRLMMT